MSIPTVLVSDCSDSNATMRMTTALHAHFDVGLGISCVPASTAIVAAYQMVDALNAGAKIVLTNVAPRSGAAKAHHNGTPFCVAWSGARLLAFTKSLELLGVLKHFGLIRDVYEVDVAQVVKVPVWSLEEIEEINNTQFRGLYYLPKLASLAWAAQFNYDTLSCLKLTDLGRPPDQVWWVDCFGNAKLTRDVPPQVVPDGTLVPTSVGKFPYYEHLRDVPDGEVAITRGSSGLGRQRRLLEIVISGDSAADRLGLTIGKELAIDLPIIGN